MLLPMVRAGDPTFELSEIPGQQRAAIRYTRGRKTRRDPAQTYIADGFLAGAGGDALDVPDAVFLVRRDTILPDAPRKLTRLTHAGEVRWTVPLPEAVTTATAERDGVILIGRTRAVSIAAADGAQRWSTPHQP